MKTAWKAMWSKRCPVSHIGLHSWTQQEVGEAETVGVRSALTEVNKTEYDSAQSTKPIRISSSCLGVCELNDISLLHVVDVVITFEERQQQDHHFEMWSKHLVHTQSADMDIFYLVKCCSEHQDQTEWVATVVCSFNELVCEFWYLLALCCKCWQWFAWTQNWYLQEEWLLGKLLRPSETRSGSPVHSILTFTCPSGKQRWK